MAFLHLWVCVVVSLQCTAPMKIAQLQLCCSHISTTQTITQMLIMTETIFLIEANALEMMFVLLSENDGSRRYICKEVSIM